MGIGFNKEPDQASGVDGQLPPAVELSVVVVNWKSANYVRECIKSIRQHAPAFSFEIIVVDSGSFDGCGEMLSREFPNVRFVQSQNNVGFATANNLGAELARGRFLLFLNPDTEVSAGALEKLVAALEQFPSAGLAGARLLNSDGSLQTSCIQSFPTILNQVLDSEWLRRIFPNSRLWGMAPLRGKSVVPSAVEVVSGACILIRRSLFKSLSGFDRRFFMYSEDLDICYRVRQSDSDCLYVPDAIIVHHGGGASNSARSMFSVVMMRESVCRLFKFHRRSFAAFGYRAAMGCSALIRLPFIFGGMAIQKIGGGAPNSKSLRKWIAILRWSLGLESWASQQQGNKEVKPSPDGDSKNCRAVSADAETRKSCAV